MEKSELEILEGNSRAHRSYTINEQSSANQKMFEEEQNSQNASDTVKSCNSILDMLRMEMMAQYRQVEREQCNKDFHRGYL